MSFLQLSIDTFPSWARLNDIKFNRVKLEDIQGKGYGLVASEDISADSHSAAAALPIIQIPQDLVLSAEAVDEYAKVDFNFRQLLDVAGRKV